MNQESTAVASNSYDDRGMRARIAGLVSCAIAQAQAAGELPEFEVSDFGIERTNDAQKGDWTSTVAMRSSKAAHRAPRDIAAAIIAHMPADEAVVSVEAAGPGFLNFSLAPEAICGVFGQVIREGADFGRCNDGQGKKVDVEFVSANPVGPMHVGHGRWAALGDSMCRTLEFCGWDVTREFYINDAGNQMNTFARSIEKRYRQIVELVEGGKTVDEALETLEADRVAALDDADGTLDTHPLTDDFAGELGGDAYGGSYIWDIARVFLQTSRMYLPGVAAISTSGSPSVHSILQTSRARRPSRVPLTSFARPTSCMRPRVPFGSVRPITATTRTASS